MRQNKASRFNRGMMIGMLFMGIVVLGIVFAFWYWAGNAQKDKKEKDSLATSGDTITIQMQIDPSIIDSLAEADSIK